MGPVRHTSQSVIFIVSGDTFGIHAFGKTSQSVVIEFRGTGGRRQLDKLLSQCAFHFGEDVSVGIRSLRSEKRLTVPPVETVVHDSLIPVRLLCHSRLSVHHVILGQSSRPCCDSVVVHSFRSQRFGEGVILRHGSAKTVVNHLSCHKADLLTADFSILFGLQQSAQTVCYESGADWVARMLSVIVVSTGVGVGIGAIGPHIQFFEIVRKIFHTDGVWCHTLLVWRGDSHSPAEAVILIPHLIAIDVRGLCRLAETEIVFRSGDVAQIGIYDHHRVGVHRIVILVFHRQTLSVGIGRHGRTAHIPV